MCRPSNVWVYVRILFSDCANQFFPCVTNSYDPNFIGYYNGEKVKGALCCCNAEHCNLSPSDCIAFSGASSFSTLYPSSPLITYIHILNSITLFSISFVVYLINKK